MYNINLLGLGILIAAIVINIFLTLFVYLSNPKNVTNRIFALLGTSISLWLIIFYLSIQSFSPDTSLLLIRLSLFFATPMSMLFLLLATTLPSNKLKIQRRYLVTLLLLTVLEMIVTLTPYTFTEVQIINNAPAPSPGFAIALFGLFVISCVLLSIYALVVKYKKSIRNEKQQIGFILLGIFLMYGLLIGTVLIPVALFNNNSFVIFAPLYTLFFLLTTAYSVIKHKFLDIHFVVARSVSYSLLIFFLGLFYSAGFFIVKIFITKEKIEPTNLISSTIIALIIAFSFQPMRKILEKITAKIFFKDSYSANVLLQSLSRIMASTLFLSDMTALILRELLSNMKVSFGYIVLIKDQKIIWKHAEGTGFPSKFNNDEILFLVRAIVLILKESSFNIDDLPESREKTIMHEHGFNIILPLVVKDEIIGVVLLGEKASGSIYSAEDINVLKILAPEVAVGVKNALAYEEIKNFNVTLANEVKQATENLTQANNRLRELDVLKTEFVSLASHELRTPMTAIKSYLWMALAGRGGPLTEKQKFYLDRAYNSTDRLIKLVNDMLNISRIESGRLTLEMQKVDLQLLTQDVIDEIMPRSQELGVTIALHKASGIPEVIADPNKIKEVLLNLIGNSLKFTPKNGIVVISFSNDDTYVTTKVTDSGSGIDPEDMSKLFQKFGFVQGSYTVNQTASQGTGLGLYISKSIVELHKGKITAYSEGVHKGSTFTFSLMIYHEDDMRQFRELTHDQVRNPVELIHTQI